MAREKNIRNSVFKALEKSEKYHFMAIVWKDSLCHYLMFETLR